MPRAAALLVLLSFLIIPALADDLVEIKDPAEFAKIVPANPKLEKLATDMRFVEGPVWINDDAGGHLLFSDIPAHHIKRWSDKAGLSVFREESHQSNGNYLDAQGRL